MTDKPLYEQLVEIGAAKPEAWESLDRVTISRELELIDGMIEVQLHHAAQCDRIANRTMADKQKGWDLERVALLRKMRAALAAQPPAAVPLLTDAQVDAISMGLFGCINAAYRKQITDAVLSSGGGGGITCATKRTVAQVRTATSAAPAAVPLTDEQILQIAEPFGAFQYGDAQGHVRIEFARAVLASGEKT